MGHNKKIFLKMTVLQDWVMETEERKSLRISEAKKGSKNLSSIFVEMKVETGQTGSGTVSSQEVKNRAKKLSSNQ